MITSPSFESTRECIFTVYLQYSRGDGWHESAERPREGRRYSRCSRCSSVKTCFRDDNRKLTHTNHVRSFLVAISLLQIYWLLSDIPLRHARPVLASWGCKVQPSAEYSRVCKSSKHPLALVTSFVVRLSCPLSQQNIGICSLYRTSKHD